MRGSFTAGGPRLDAGSSGWSLARLSWSTVAANAGAARDAAP